MALVPCPDCQREISDTAPACIHCGRPMKAAPEVVTIEQTGKSAKTIMLVGAAMMALGLVACVAGGTVFQGAVLSVIGLVVYVVGAVTGWWRHG